MIRHFRRGLGVIARHKVFSVFFALTLGVNTYLLVYHQRATTDFITCSTFDRGALGTYALFMDLSSGKMPVTRLQLSPYRALDLGRDSARTLVIMTPRFQPQLWEWDRMLDWVARGNRLITAGIQGPRRKWYSSMEGQFLIRTVRRPPDSISVLLPLDTIFPYPRKLPPSPFLGSVLFPNHMTDWGGDTLSVRYFDPGFMEASALPFLAMGDKPIALKQVIGRGQLVSFTIANPFCNELLRDSAWYHVAVRLLAGDSKYGGGEVLFDEFHNGYTASKNLWQLLTYYRFDEGLVYLGVIALLYLFFTGVRILTPAPCVQFQEKSPLAGLRAVSSLFVRHRAYAELLRREAASMARFPAVSRGGDPDQELVTTCPDKGGPLLAAGGAGELIGLIKEAREASSDIDGKRAVELFNALVKTRKELRT